MVVPVWTQVTVDKGKPRPHSPYLYHTHTCYLRHGLDPYLFGGWVPEVESRAMYMLNRYLSTELLHPQPFLGKGLSMLPL